MNEPMIRGYWLTSAAKFLRAHYPPDTGERLLGSMPKPLKALLPNVYPVMWYSRAHHVDILNAIVAVARDEASAVDSLMAYGHTAATDLAMGPLRPLFPILTPRLLAKKLPDLWAGAHKDDGCLESDIADVDEGRLGLQISGLDGYEHVGVATLGWVRGLLVAVGKRNITVNQTAWSLAAPNPNNMSCEVQWS